MGQNKREQSKDGFSRMGTTTDAATVTSTKFPSVFAGEQPPDFDIKPPEPRRRYTKSTFGPQCLSSKLTEPSCRFGRGHRIGIEKLYIDSEISKLTPGQSPGPIYEVGTTIGKQVVSEIENPPEIGFPLARRFSKKSGTGAPGPGAYDSASSFGEQVLSYQKSPEKAVIGKATRDQQQKVYLSQDFDKSKFGIESPGPAVCDTRSSIGDQSVSANKTAPHIKFGSDTRFKYGKKGTVDGGPGAGQYKRVGALGKQPESSKTNRPIISFTHANREQRQKIFISMDHEKGNCGIESPGPATNIKLISSLGFQPNSKKLNPPCWRFGSTKRFRTSFQPLPGPGEYDC